jgi:lipoprotein NlpI
MWYFGKFNEAFAWRCESLFDRYSDTNNTGQMRVQFHLNSDGYTSDFIVLTNTVESELSRRFENALVGSFPFDAWPAEMRRVQYAGYFTMRCGFALARAPTNRWHSRDSLTNHRPTASRNFETDPAYLVTGLLKEHTNDYPGAIAEYTKAIGWDRQDAWAFNHRGLCRARLKDYFGSFSDLSAALELDPQNSSAWNNRAFVRYQLKDYSGTLSDYARGFNLNSNVSGAYANRASARIRLRDYDGAMADLNTCLDMAPTNTQALVNRGRIKRILHDYQGAIEDCDKALALNGRYAYAFVNKGYIQQEQSKNTASIENFRNAIGIDESLVYPRLQIWAILCSDGKTKDATEQLRAHAAGRFQTELGKWSYQLESFLAGFITEQALLAAAEQSAITPHDCSDQLCEATYYVGLKHLFAGEKEQATDLFRQCIATDAKDFIEYSLARSELGKIHAGY